MISHRFRGRLGRQKERRNNRPSDLSARKDALRKAPGEQTPRIEGKKSGETGA
jgi:hypothetical protein